ncbi:MAG: hypothetical protein JST22_13265 [Bacteroidetes bacterium]|nr:hypothetical protein [Bacteroidota bacterium]
MPFRSFIVLLLALVGCSASHDATRESGAGVSDSSAVLQAVPPLITDDSAVAAVHRLESDPLDSAAALLRAPLFSWMIASDRLSGFQAITLPIDELSEGNYRYANELVMQYMLGCAAWHVSRSPGAMDTIEEQAAGIRSMIAAYRTMVRTDPSLRDPFLDRLDDIRRRGDLRSFIEHANKSE